MLGKLSPEQIELLLKSEMIGRIGCYAENKIYVVPVTYAYADGYIYAHSANGMKIKMMRENPEVCFEIDSMQDMGNWQSVIAWGRFEELIVPETKMAGMKLLVDRFMPIMTSETARPHETSPHGTGAQEAVVFRIKLREKTGRYEKR